MGGTPCTQVTTKVARPERCLVLASLLSLRYLQMSLCFLLDLPPLRIVSQHPRREEPKPTPVLSRPQGDTSE